MTITAISETPADRSAGVQLTDYQLRLPGFDGPLDVLLRLIEREQLPVAELSLVQVTDQFIEAMRALDEAAPPSLIADFAAVGTRLALLKSRSLLPRAQVAEPEPEPGDLVQQLLRYRAYKDAAGQLAGRDVVDHAAFHAAGRSAHGVDPPPVRLADHPPASLVRVIRRRLSQIAQPARIYAVGRVVSLREMVATVALRLASRGVVRFSEVAAGCQGRSDIQTAFLAGLVLVRRGMADAEQPELFGEITFRAIVAPGGEYLAGLAGDVTAEFDPSAAERDPPRSDARPGRAGFRPSGTGRRMTDSQRPALDSGPVPPPDGAATDSDVTPPATGPVPAVGPAELPLPAVPEAELPGLLEALLLVAPGPSLIADLARGAGVGDGEIERALADLAERYADDGAGMIVQRHAGTVQLASAPRFARQVRRFLKLDRETRLSTAALETLAIVAYQQPVTRSEIDAVRGVDSSGVLATLHGRGLVEQVGRLSAPGNPVQYGTTAAFLRHFGLRSVGDLPPLGQLDGRDALETLRDATSAIGSGGNADLTAAEEVAPEHVCAEG